MPAQLMIHSRVICKEKKVGLRTGKIKFSNLCGMREAGYYWVKPKKNQQVSGEWMIMQWKETYFWHDGEDYDDWEFEEIDERRIERDKTDLNFSGLKIIESNILPPGIIITKDTGEGFKQIYP